MSVLITGGSGFIGAQVARLLVERGEERVVAFDVNPSTQRLDEVAERVELVRGDLGDFSHVLAAVKRARPRAIFHLGSMLSVPSDADPSAAIRVNALGTYHVLVAARLFEVPQVLFSSTVVTYSADIKADVVDDYTLQRPQLIYGATKLFGETLGRFFRRKYGLDFRGVRYPSIVGPGVRTPGVLNYTSWSIEQSIRGNPFTIQVRPESRCPIMYFKDAARAIVQLSEAPQERIKMVVYLIAGVAPVPSAQELVDAIRARVPEARIDFQPELEMQRVLDGFLRPIDDHCARAEWGWHAEYDLERLIDDYLKEMALHPGRYA